MKNFILGFIIAILISCGVSTLEADMDQCGTEWNPCHVVIVNK